MNIRTAIQSCLLGVSLSLVPFAHAAVTAEPDAAPFTRPVTRPVNINTADAATLAGSLQGIGMKKAEAIVAYRNEHGPFKSVDDLMNVKGIGEKMLEKLRQFIAI